MVVHLLDGIERSEFVALVERLESEELADGCIIGKRLTQPRCYRPV